MKTIPALILWISVFGLLTDSFAQPADPAQKQVPTEAKDKPPEPAPPPAPAGEEKGLRLNFRGVPLEMVLDYLSDAAGFIIVLETEVKGRVDAWSNQPLTRDEAVSLLNTVLNKNGYAAIRNGRTLRIVSREEAKSKDIPVRSGADPGSISKSDEMITQVIPVRYANANQLVQNLTPLLPTYANLSANESGNALVLTDTQSDVRRMVEIVQALDTAISSISTIRVFALRYADAKDLASAVKELFAPPTNQQNNNDRRNQFFNRFFGGGGPGGGFGGGPGGGAGGGTRGGNSTGNVNASRVVAVADERMNALIVSAPDDYIPTIEKLVREVDVSATDVTELRVFRLSNSDPMELADIFAELFPDETKTGTGNSNPQQGDVRFRGGGFQGNANRAGQGNANRAGAQSDTSDRMKKKGRVIAVPDQRTSSLIVSAASELMPQIEEMIAQLDASPARKQKVFVYSLENADAQQVEQILRDMFDRSGTSANRNSQMQNNALINRSQQNQQGSTMNGAVGNSSLGNNGGQAGTGQLFR
jgi:general secretion pathway protein D